jgi:hypothetical protein
MAYGASIRSKQKKYIKDDNNNSYILYKCIINLAYIDPNYVIPVFNYIKDSNRNPSVKKFFEYLKIII